MDSIPKVTPHAGVRIEMNNYLEDYKPFLVTPHAGVRIEICCFLYF